MSGRAASIVPILLAILGVIAGPASARAEDSTSVSLYILEPVVVTASRLPVSAYEMANAFSVLTAEDAGRVPATTLADVLSLSEGLHMYDFSGAGTDPAVETRGFLSAGESSYLLMCIDGVPMNELETDEIDWGLCDLEDVQRIEVLRGPTSTMYGNIGMSGLLNVVTKAPRQGLTSKFAVTGGTHSNQGAMFGAAYGRGLFRSALSADRRKIVGWRENSAWEVTRLHTVAALGPRDGGEITLRAVYLDSRKERPGAIPRGYPQRETLTPSDHTESRKFHLTVSALIGRGDDLDFKLNAAVGTKSSDEVQTVFQQAKDHKIESTTYSAGAHMRLAREPGDRVMRIAVGIEGALGRSNGEYRDVDSPGAGSSLLEVGETSRSTLAMHATGQFGLSQSLTCLAGARYDAFWDEYRSSFPLNDRSEAGNFAFSPSLALNWRVGESAASYASVARSFKVPTLEQLFDRRPFTVPDPSDPGEFTNVTLSNAGLKPQKAWNYETGFHAACKGVLAVNLSLYWLHVEDEIGFDLADLSYANIDESIHWGMESGVKAKLASDLYLRLSYTFTRAVFEGGEYDGNQINGVPKHLLGGSLEYGAEEGPAATLKLDYIGKRFLDEGNHYVLDGYATVAAKVGYRYSWLVAEVGVQNLFEVHYDAAGFLSQDETGAPLPMYYPGRKREIVAKLSASL